MTAVRPIIPPLASSTLTCTSVALLLLLGAAVSAAATLDGPLERLEPWIGTWQIEAQWSTGTPLWAQSEHRPILGGAFLEARIFVREGDKELYQRYRSIFAWDTEAEGFVAHGFAHGGSYGVAPFEIEGSGVGMVYSSSWEDEGTQIKEQQIVVSADEMRWQVWMRGPEQTEWNQIMDGTWRRVEAGPIELEPPAGLEGDLARLEPFVGGWETGSRRPGGRQMWIREEIEPALAGFYLQTATWVAEGEGELEQRSTSMIGAGPEGLHATSFLSNGSWIDVDVRIEGEPGHETMISELPAAPGPGGAPWRLLRQEMRLETPDSFSWATLMRPAETAEAEWKVANQGLWYRQGGSAAATTQAIRPERMVASGCDLRSFTKEAIVAAPAAEVFTAWTTSEGWSKVFGPPSAARIELAIGGRYEWLFDGHIGSNGCQVLSYIPDRMISFTWNAPPSQPEARVMRTWVVVELEPIEEGGSAATQVRLTHLGFGEGPVWDADIAYFENAWGRVLGAMQGRLAAP